MNVDKIRVYKDLLLPNCRYSPFLFSLGTKFNNPEQKFFNPFRSYVESNFEIEIVNGLTDRPSVFFTPHFVHGYFNNNEMNRLKEINSYLIHNGNRVVTFAGGIDCPPIGSEILFQDSTYERVYNSIPSPLWMYDLGIHTSELKRRKNPKISFIANTNYPGLITSTFGNINLPSKVIYHFASSYKFNTTAQMRYKQLLAKMVRKRVAKQLRACNNLDVNVRERNNNYFVLSEELKRKYRMEFISSIRDSDYTVCTRGDANSSYMMYEILSMGRIPILIDTSLRLPNEDQIHWDRICIRIPFYDIKNLEKHVLDFHTNMNEKEFELRCKEARKAFEDLMPHNFIVSNLQKHTDLNIS